MAGLTLYKSNHAERLVGELAELLRSPLASPLVSEVVVVQSLGMRKWLSLELAAAHGVCANVRFPFPKAFLDGVLATMFPGGTEDDYFERATLTWRIMQELPALLANPVFEPVQNYVRGDNDALRLYQFSEKVANLFDQYIVFRPRMLLQWERGDEADWQAVLWRELVKGHPHHQAALGIKFADALKRGASSLRKLPQRVSVFGISSLSPFYLEFFDALSRTVDVHFFLLDPSEHLWAHIVSPSEEDVIRRKMNPAASSGDLHAENRNSLLASFGRTGRDFQKLVLDLEPAETRELYVPPKGQNLLAQIQADIFNLEDPPAKRLVSPQDTSLQIHSCHSPMRELEVLYDHLLSLFETIPGLTPRDIVVMTPDVTTYAPFIEAVFGCPERTRLEIPFTIADRGMTAENPLAQTFLQMLELCAGRFGVGEILGLLETKAVRQRYGLSESDVDTLRSWAEETGIRWGIDAAHRQKLGLPPLDENTWRQGFRRLLLGYALPARNRQLYEGILPCDRVEGSLAETLGSFIEFGENLFTLARQAGQPRSLTEWHDLLQFAVGTFFSAGEDHSQELISIRQAIASLRPLAERSGFSEKIPAQVILSHLRRTLETEESPNGFMHGQVTFCTLRPMRSIPFKVLCLVGMNDGSFPRPQTALGFDRMMEHPQPGDRSSRLDDRYLFLDAILSAREVLYISYVGQSIRDNSLLTPSVLVTELLDYIERSFELPDKQIIQDHVLRRHKLQAFSADYFKNERYWSYSAENHAASRTSLASRQTTTAFFEKDLAEPGEEWLTVELDSLAQFFCNPAEFLLRHRLEMRLSQPDDALSESENFSVGGLVGYQARQLLVDRLLEGSSPAEAIGLLKATGQLPPGHIGDCHAQTLVAEVVAFVDKVRKLREGMPLNDISVHRTIGRFELVGQIHGGAGENLLRYRCAAIKPKDLLRTWIQHLAANLDNPRSSLIVGLEDARQFKPVPDAEKVLRGLLEIYWSGLSAPVRFFPSASFAFVDRKLRPKKGEQAGDAKVITSAFNAAWDAWLGNDLIPGATGESQDPYFALCFRDVADPFDEHWRNLAEQVFEPLLLHSEEVDL